MGITRFIDRSTTRLRTYLDMVREIANSIEMDKAEMEHLSEFAMTKWEKTRHKNAERVIFEPISHRKQAVRELMQEYKTLLKPKISNSRQYEQILKKIQNSFEELFEI